MSELAYNLESEHLATGEQYSQSLSTLRALGRVSLDIIPLHSDVPEVQEAWTDFVSALEENIATDPELSEKLTFNPLRLHEVINGQVVDRTGRAVTEIVSDGLFASKQQALADPRMEVQVERDEGDVLVANTVNNLSAGELLAVISMDPKEALAADNNFWEDKGYRSGMAVLQVYYRSDQGVLAGAYAIKDSDAFKLREHFADYGLEIPEYENCNRWTRHQLKLNIAEDEARSFGDKFVRRYRRKLGLDEHQLSTTEFLKNNQSEVQSYFDTYIVPVASSTVTGINNEATRSLADSIHQRNAEHLSSDERAHLLKVANSKKFTDLDARFMESKVRYALIEHLRPKLKTILEIPEPVVRELSNNSTHYAENTIRTIWSTDPAQLRQMNAHLALGFERGVRDNRSYGGCASSRIEAKNPSNELGTQDIFGGKFDQNEDEGSGDKDEFGPLEFKCTKGHTNKREKGGWVYECHKCGEDVSCGKKKP